MEKTMDLVSAYESSEMDRVMAEIDKWDTYFHDICKVVSSKSPCLSRQIGAILVRDHSIIATGFNGPPRGVPHCGHDRLMKDNVLSQEIEFCSSFPNTDALRKVCPRKLLNYKSGEGMQWCPAQHAERNAISNAARLGVPILNSTLYMNSIIPCQQCFGAIINAGIDKIVIEDVKVYDKHTQFLINNSDIKMREFRL